MSRGLCLLFIAGWMLSNVCAQEPSSAPTEARSTTTETTTMAAPSRESVPMKRSLFGRILHPFSGGAAAPQSFNDPKLRGLVLDLQITPQTVKLSEVRQLQIKLTLTNQGKRTINLDFPTDQRIDIYLMNSAEIVLTKWSDNHAFAEKLGTLLINPQEHVEYNETISTRELTPGKVFIAEVFFPKYPELRARQKFLTAP